MLVKTFSVAVAATLITVAGTLGLMVADRDMPVEVLDDVLVTKQVKAGDSLERTVTFIQRKRCYIHSDRAVFDSRNERHLLPPLEFHAGNFGPVGKKQRITVRIPVPSDARPGPARLETQTLFRCNLFHWVWPIYGNPITIHFEVIP